MARVEIAPTHLFLTNRNIGDDIQGYKAEFEARYKVSVGKNDISGNQSIYEYNTIDGNIHYLSEEGDFVVSNNSQCIIHAGDEIEFLPGTTIEVGSELIAVTEPFFCNDALYRTENTTNAHQLNENDTIHKIFADENGMKEKEQNYSKIIIFPNPNNIHYFEIQFKGRQKVRNINIRINNIVGMPLVNTNYMLMDNEVRVDISQLQEGIYIVDIESTELNIFTRQKLIISK